MNPDNIVYRTAVWIIPLVIAIVFHEVAHGWMAKWLGDPTAAVDDRFAAGTITSRIGLEAPATPFDAATDLAACVVDRQATGPLACVLVDEAQFLSTGQVDQLAKVADDLGVPVLAYGLRTDFRGALFPGSARLLAIADALIELKSVCTCGRKATMNLRVDANGRAVRDGQQTEIGGNDRYVALCRRHFTEALAR